MQKNPNYFLSFRAAMSMAAAYSLLCALPSAAAGLADRPAADPASGTYDLTVQTPPDPAARPLQFRRAGSRDKIRLPIGWQAERYATDLGDVTALCAVGDQYLYVLDKARGRLYELWDRRANGQMDVKRPVLRDLISPEDIVCAESGVYIASATDILFYDPAGRSLTAYVSLRNLSAEPSPRRLLLDAEGQALYLAFAPQPRSHKLVKIDLATRRAETVTSGPGTITALAKSGGSPVWAAIDNSLQPLITDEKQAVFNPKLGVSVGRGSVISSVTLPGSYAGPPELTPWAQDIFITQSGDASFGDFGGPLNIAAIKTAFGQPKPELQIFADGFVGKHGRTAWGEPSALHIDARGLFLADRQSAALWRIFPAAAPQALKDDPKPEPKPKDSGDAPKDNPKPK